jgi:hypothetical protein
MMSRSKQEKQSAEQKSSRISEHFVSVIKRTEVRREEKQQ